MSEYREESDALDADIHRVIAAWHKHGTLLSDEDFNHLALRIFSYQLRYNQPDARYCRALGVDEARLPERWESIPPVPAAAFKDSTLTTGDPAKAALAFETSGTSLGRGGIHYLETRELYDAALLAGFDRSMLGDGARLRYFNIVPNPAERPQSSLGYMMAKVAADRGDGNAGWYVRGDDLLVHAFVEDVRAAAADGVAVCIAGTAFGFVTLLDAFAKDDISIALPAGSRIMETGGFKGRTRVVSRDELYAKLAMRFEIDTSRIVAEYGMTELTSQYYDTADSRTHARRVKAGPPWLRARVVKTSGADETDGIVGALVHVDLANRSSAIAVATEDLGSRVDGGFVLLGRDEGAALRGCSLDAEDLRPHA